MVNRSAVLDRTFHALAHPARRAMVARLARGAASVTELAAPLAMSLPAAHKHLRVLEAAGLLQCEKAGRVRHCRLDADALADAVEWIEERRAIWSRRLDALDRVLTGGGIHETDDRTGTGADPAPDV